MCIQIGFRIFYTANMLISPFRNDNEKKSSNDQTTILEGTIAVVNNGERVSALTKEVKDNKLR